MDQAREQVQHLFDQQEMTLQCEQTEFSTQHNYVCDTDVCWLGKTVNTVNFLCDTKKVTCDNNNPNGEMACKEAEENN